jgi:hypothetical protein
VLTHGGKDHGAAELRLDLGLYYYAAFILDPDGDHIEAVIYQAKSTALAE